MSSEVHAALQKTLPTTLGMGMCFLPNNDDLAVFDWTGKHLKALGRNDKEAKSFQTNDKLTYRNLNSMCFDTKRDLFVLTTEEGTLLTISNDGLGKLIKVIDKTFNNILSFLSQVRRHTKMNNGHYHER